ncbi:MAG: baeRF10 domain-containing protein [Solirubrobacteraceae bacterium]
MQSPAATSVTLRRLSRIVGEGDLVLSVYVSLDPSLFPTPGARESELHALLAEARKQGAEAGAERVREHLEANPGLMAGVTAVAAFVGAGGEPLQIVELPEPVEPRAVVAHTPWLEPLVRVLHSDDWAVALVSRRAARIFRGGRAGLTETAAIEDDVHRRHAQGGWSQSRFQRGIDEEVAAHVRRVADELFDEHQRDPVAHLVLSVSPEIWPVMLDALHPDLRGRVAGRIDVDCERAEAHEVLQATIATIEAAEAGHRRELLERLDEELGTQGRAAAGLPDVLAALERGRAATLFLAGGVTLGGRRCPECGRVGQSGDRCPLDGTAMEDVDAAEHALALATRQDAEVVVLDDGELRDHGSIAALLRY